MYSRALSRRLPPPTPPPLYQVARRRAGGGLGTGKRRGDGVDRSNPAAADRRARHARPTACDRGAVPARAAGRATVGPKTVLIALPARPGWIGSDRIGRWQPEMPTPTHGVPRDRRAALPRSPVPCHYAAARKPPGFSRTFLGNFSEISPKLLRSCSEVARKFPGDVEAVHAPSCDIPLPLAMFGGRRTACAAGLHVGMVHCTGAAQTRASQVGRPGCKLDGFRKWEVPK